MMSLINKLLKQSKAEPRPAELIIRRREVDAMVDFFVSLNWGAVDRCYVRANILDGRARAFGIPLRVIK